MIFIYSKYGIIIVCGVLYFWNLPRMMSVTRTSLWQRVSRKLFLLKNLISLWPVVCSSTSAQEIQIITEIVPLYFARRFLCKRREQFAIVYWIIPDNSTLNNYFLYFACFLLSHYICRREIPQTGYLCYFSHFSGPFKVLWPIFIDRFLSVGVFCVANIAVL